MRKAEILITLPKLDRADLEEVAAVCQHLLNTGPAGSVAPEGASGLGPLCFDALAATVGASMRHSSLPPNLAKKLNSQLGPLKQFLDNDFKGWDAKRITSQAFLTFLMGLLSDMLTAYETKPSVRTMILNLDKVPRAFDNQFPNYRASNLGGMILKRFI